MPRLILAILLCSLSLWAADPIPVILDTDIGDDIDDALALAVALQSPELQVLGVVTVLQRGERRADLTWRILELYGRTDIPVGVGAEQPLIAPGRDSFVKQTDQLAADYHIPASRRRGGIQLIIDTITQAPQKVTLLAYGPATNVALALRAEPRIREKIERIVLMNGVFFRAGLEYNTYRDPEASQIVYNSGVPVVAVGLDVTMKCRLNEEHLRQMQSSPHESVRFLRRLITSWQNGNAKQFPILHDPLAVLVSFQPDLVELVSGTVQVEVDGKPGVSYGLTSFKAGANGNVRVAQDVRAGSAVDLFMSRVAAAPRRP
ncbi:MAG TPA: nucleoside hydrolase [Bryobacteraceae bacterium]|nr:nucleoside hydrolase [Bryobacteraceae bacterium]